MNASKANLLNFLDGTKQFQVPIWQRRYSWKKENCEQLWNDVLHVGADKDATTYFLGSIVSMEPGDNTSGVLQLLVIDGQQRLTTLSLLLAALGRTIEARNVEIGIDRGRIEDYYLFNFREKGGLRYKQRLTEHDKETLNQLLDVGEASDNTSLLVENYYLFEVLLKRADLADLKAVFEGIRKLMIVDIVLEYGSDNPQLIFDSLNSTGLELTPADRIRNYVLMGQNSDVQKQLYNDHWHPMEKRFGNEYTKPFNSFIRDYLTLKTGQIPTIKGVYDSFKLYMKNKKSPEILKETVKEIDHYSKHYVRIALRQEEDPEIRACLEDIHALNVKTVFSFLLGVYEDYTQGQIKKAEVIEILRLIESYIFRRDICELPSNSLYKTFAALTRQIDKDNYIQSLKIAFSQRSRGQRFPGNEEFKQRFISTELYPQYYSKFSTRDYLLRKLENYERKEECKEPTNFGGYTIEHVMPQDRDLSEEWQKELGKNWREVQKKIPSHNWQPYPYQAQFKVRQ
jgi:uncharacterized protein with ParB-like and HNH nuclease domain